MSSAIITGTLVYASLGVVAQFGSRFSPAAMSDKSCAQRHRPNLGRRTRCRRSARRFGPACTVAAAHASGRAGLTQAHAKALTPVLPNPCAGSPTC
eukprot:3939704-Prymnesium_polylepis.1